MRADRIAVIKTGWCLAYAGEQWAEGQFEYLEEGGAGGERFNMQSLGGVFQVYAMPKGKSADDDDLPPRPSPTEGWTIVHVARDPAVGKVKLVGWYEGAKFLGRYKKRTRVDGDYRSWFCIEAGKARLLEAKDRPIVEHDGRFGQSSVYWLRGNEKWRGKSWDEITRRIERLISSARPLARDPAILDSKDVAELVGDTMEPAEACAGLEVDDGGIPYGRCGPAESPEHEALRIWARDNGGKLTGCKDALGNKTEFPQPSGDRVDAAHWTEDDIWLVEAKSRNSGEKDHERGIYQCIKYRAVQEEVERSARGKARRVHTILLTEKKLSDRLRTMAERLGIALYRKRYS